MVVENPIVVVVDSYIKLSTYYGVSGSTTYENQRET